MRSPGIPAVETEGDLIHAAWVSHHQIKTRLKADGRYINSCSLQSKCANVQETRTVSFSNPENMSYTVIIHFKDSIGIK